MVGPTSRPQFVLFGSSIVQFSYSYQGWGAILADLYARKSLSDETRIIFLSAPAMNEAQITEVFGNSLGRSNDSCRRYSEACQLGQELAVKVFDLWTTLQQRDDWLTACFTDGIHLSSEGSKLVVKEILKVLKEAEWEPNLDWRSLSIEFPEISPYIFVDPKGETAVNVSQLDLSWQTQWH